MHSLLKIQNDGKISKLKKIGISILFTVKLRKIVKNNKNSSKITLKNWKNKYFGFMISKCL